MKVLLTVSLGFIFLCFPSLERTQDPEEDEEVEINQEKQEGPHQKSPGRSSAIHMDSNYATTEEDMDSDCLSTSDKRSSVQPVSSLRSAVASSHFNPRSSMRSLASSCEGTGPVSAVGLASSRGRLSSCSTVMITEEQLMLNPVKPQVCRFEMNFPCFIGSVFTFFIKSLCDFSEF